MFALDPAEVGVDTQTPGTPVVGAVKITRGRGTQGGCLSGSISSCDGLGTILIPAAATDDRTSVEMMGFRLKVTRGQVPSDLFSQGKDVRTIEGEIFLPWSDGADDDQESLDFDLEVRALDRAGNVSVDAVTVTVRDDQGGCRVARSGSRRVSDLFAMFAAVSWVAWTSFRRRQRN